MNNMARTVFAAALALLPAIAQAQNPVVLQAMPPNTVVGRLGISPGPVQAIPFDALKKYLGTMTGPGSATVGNLALFNSTTGNVLKDGGPITAFGLSMAGAANAAAAYGVLGVIPCAQTAALTGDITKAAGSCVVTSTYTSSLTGAVARNLRSKLGDHINAADFGVVCDGVTDTRVQLQQAINSTPVGGTLYISKASTTGACMISAATSVYGLQRTEPFNLVCDTGVAIQPAFSFTSSASVLYLVGSANGVTYNTTIDGCSFGNLGAATRLGLHGIVFDTTTTGTYFRQPIVKNVFIQGGATGSGYGIYTNNGAGNINGGIYGGALGMDSKIHGGIFLGNAGDSLTIGPRAIIPQIGSGAGYDNNGIYVYLVAGAGNLTFDNLNFTQSGGITIDAGYNVIFDKGEYELQAALTGQAIINISANVATVTGVRIRNLQMQAVGGIGTPLFLKASSNAQHIIFDGNSVATPTNYSPISNASTSFQMGPNFWQVGGAAHISGTAAANTYGGG